LSLQEVAGVLPSPAASSNGHRHGYSISSMTSSALPTSPSPLSAPHSADFSASKKLQDTHPSEWNVEQVADWLRAKGFDDMVCDMFVEQEITGDVLLELDVGVLKSEIGIVAYGKRIRIANAIAELRRPLSMLSSEQPTRSGSFTHRSSLAQLDSINSPATLPSPGFGTLASPETPPDLVDPLGQPSDHMRYDSDPGVRTKPTDSNVTIGLGLGIPSALVPGNAQAKAAVSSIVYDMTGMVPLMDFETQKARPPQLSLSPSDPALVANIRSAPVPEHVMEDDRGVLSEVGHGSRHIRNQVLLTGDPCRAIPRMFRQSAAARCLDAKIQRHQQATRRCLASLRKS
jgi:hypothetical protein